MAAIDIPEVHAFMATTPPFTNLNELERKQVLTGVSLVYVRQRQVLSLEGDTATVHLIRRGACEIRTPEGGLVDQIADGECFGVSSVLSQNPDGLTVVAMEDSLVYRFDKAHFVSMLEKNAAFGLFFEHTRHSRQRKLSLSQDHSLASSGLQLSAPIANIMTRELILASPEETVQTIAIRMTQARVSSILVVEQGRLIGIVTDRDLRSRILAVGGDGTVRVKDIMTAEPISLTSDVLVMQAQILMSERHVHHLPIVNEQKQPVGMLTAADLLRHQELSPLLLINQIHRQTSINRLAEVCKQWPALIMNLITTDMKPADVGKVLATVSDNLTRRVITLALEKVGPAPMAFHFLVFGSQARRDQSLGSDQDNGLMLEREPTPAENDYFIALSECICQGLASCGIRLCPGNIMASNPEWRRTQAGWQNIFVNWIKSSAPSALLHASIFFDIRCVYGERAPVDELVKNMQREISTNSVFLATLTRSALASKPPLGFFRHFLLESSGEHKNQLDLKHQGLALINDLARLYGLSCRTYRTGTLNRLEQAAREKHLSSDTARNLIDAWDQLNELRLAAQSRHWQSTGKASAYLDPKTLSPLERKHLKTTFGIISDAQDVAQQHFLRGYS
ncbi:CBS domain-containing protein [Marinomonas sp. A79]|uniref:CBS domain-containing protein n=1 Tax=Marinomonas vulgaris TaxID=2823372 RepID=A0ABS5H8G4_9GAMM|nr:putative nucleotidyltransferase substrate binding domain-containing protein [Marinomonas vulgaris]MBR7887722.1 CBS domain-containing protein [Marinomonas vulgaris]